MNGIEEKFMTTFNIKPQDYYACDWDSDCPYPEKQCGDTCPYWKLYKTDYPPITDRILLELMEILLKQELQEFYYEDDTYLFSSKLRGVKRITCNKCANLKELILHTAYTLGQFTPLKDRLIKPIQSLFTEGEEC